MPSHSSSNLPSKPFSYGYWLDQMFNLWQNSGNQQVGFINISGNASAKPDVERDIIENVATYGRQLGRISDVLDILLQRADADKWRGRDAKALGDFRAMLQNIAAVKNRQLPATARNIDDLIAGINALKDADPAEYRRIRHELQSRIFDDADAQPKAKHKRPV